MFQNIENYDTYDAVEKDTDIAVIKSRKKFLFFNMFKSWGWIQIRISIKRESRFRIRIKTMPTHNNK